MATINAEIARSMIERLRKQKKPRTYCVVRYFNVMFLKWCWAYFSNRAEYESALNCSNVRNINVMWFSKKYLEDFLEE
jgi:hypothetical protein